MKMTKRSMAVWCGLVLFLVTLTAGYLTAKDLRADNDKYVCSETNPGSMCNASTTCGSTSAPCVADVKRTSESASVTPSIPDAKANAPFCVKVGTTVTWQSSSKKTGFVLDFGASSPFDTPDGAIIGGSDRSVSVVAKRPGCFKYSVGACVAGAIYGMCDSKEAEIVVTK
ncbi:MAG: hypothetical protein WAM25_21975 [Candidatus Acidiferrales bacterium]